MQFRNEIVLEIWRLDKINEENERDLEQKKGFLVRIEARKQVFSRIDCHLYSSLLGHHCHWLDTGLLLQAGLTETCVKKRGKV